MIPLAIAIVSAIVVAIIIHGTKRIWPDNFHRPAVTLLVCARNEEQYITECMLSLAAQDYPPTKFSILLVDHLSTDKTGELMDEFASMTSIPTTVIHIDEPSEELIAKTHALSVGIDRVTTEYVLLTDADCVVPPSWITTMIRKFRPNVAAVGGFVNVKSEEKDSFLTRLQHLDLQFYLSILSGTAGLRAPDRKGRRLRNLVPDFLRPLITPMRPPGWIGNNAAYRMSAYRATGGFKSFGPSLVEDYALMNAIVRDTGKYLAVTFDGGAVVTTRPQTNWGDLWRQKRRWATGVSVPNPLGLILISVMFSMRVATPWFAFWYPIETVISLLIMMVMAYLLLKSTSTLTEQKFGIRDVVYEELFQILLNQTILLASVARWPIVWKGEKYRNPS